MMTCHEDALYASTVDVVPNGVSRRHRATLRDTSEAPVG